MSRLRARIGLAMLLVAGASAGAAQTAGPTFTVPARALGSAPLVMIAYGDMRFTDRHETVASQPAVRDALVARIARERPAALFLDGDIPYHGNAADYAVFHEESAPWRAAHLRVYPALGNHEFSGCSEPQCLDLWWDEFPALRGRRWYSVALGSRVLGVALDSDASLLPGSEQRAWLEEQLDGMAASVRLVVVWLHHPPVADIAQGELASHNPRPNETALADYLGGLALQSRARFLVVAGHTHNYERFLQEGIVYLVSGGGGAHPYPIDRGPGDLYTSADFPNYHYIRLELRGRRLRGEMLRLEDPAADRPGTFRVRDRFEISLLP